MVAIVAVDDHNAIGRNGDLLCRLSGDLKRFRALTTGKTVILGRKTLSTFPGGKPLPNRRNIILSRDSTFRCEGAEVAKDIASALRMCQATNPDEVIVIGGQSVYRQLMPHIDRVYLTRIQKVFENADAFFHLVGDWREVGASAEQEEGGIRYRFCELVRAHPALP